MSLLNIAAKLFTEKVSGEESLELGSIVSALSSLLPTKENDLDLAALVGQMSNGGLTNLVSSFLGDGENGQFSPAQLLGILGDSNIADFASKLGIDKETAADGLSSMLPDLLDKESSGGSLLDNLDSSMASNVIGKLFN